MPRTDLLAQFLAELTDEGHAEQAAFRRLFLWGKVRHLLL